jgi:hypothetical protein
MRRIVLVVLIVVAALAGWWGYREFTHARRKTTITRVITVGKLCEQLGPTEVDHSSLLRVGRAAGLRDFDSDDLHDAWGKPIFVRRSPDGSHYTVWAFGEAKLTDNVDDAPYVWDRGKWLRMQPYLH